LGCCGSSSVRPKRSRTRWLSQIRIAASRLQSIRIMAKAKMIGSHSLAGSISAVSSSLAWSNSLDQRLSGLSAPENCCSRLDSVPPIKPSTPSSAAGWAFCVVSRSFFRSLSSLVRCWSFSRVLITSSRDWPNGTSACGWVLVLLPSSPGRLTAWAGAMGSRVSRQKSRQQGRANRRASTRRSTLKTTN